MKLAILGGSFNPLHIGHAMLADTIVKEYGYDKVLFIPTCVPPHKELNGGVTTAHRLGMVQAFCNSVDSGMFEVETCEIDRGGVSYTVDTLEYITEKYKFKLTEKPGLLMGEEIAAEFNKWKNPDRIAELANIIIVPRQNSLNEKVSDNSYKNSPTGNYEGDFKKSFNINSFQYPCTVLKDSILVLSSTEIRTRVSEGKSFQYLVPPAVFEYINSEKLYRK